MSADAVIDPIHNDFAGAHLIVPNTGSQLASAMIRSDPDTNCIDAP
jgi:hypothetical protein